MKKEWIEQVHQEANRIFRAQLDLALGHYREVRTAQGVIRVYKQPPNARAIEWILEQVWGKATQRVEVEGELEREQEMSPEDQELISQALNFATKDMLPSQD